MSIIIVGVGQAEFDAMVELDGDDIRISSRGKLAERDIVQFVPFRDYMDRTGNHVLSMARLAKDVLAEIPDQFISYMKSRGIKPNPAPPPYTPPGHTHHHHTQIWSPPLGFSLKTDSMQQPHRVQWELCLLFFGANRSWRTRKWVLNFVPYPPSDYRSSIFFLVCFSVICSFGWFLLKRGSNFPGLVGERLLNQHWGSDCFTSNLTAGWFKEVMLWLKLVPVCGCFSKCIGTCELWPKPCSSVIGGLMQWYFLGTFYLLEVVFIFGDCLHIF